MIQSLSKMKTQSCWVKLLLMVNLISSVALSEPTEVTSQKLVRTKDSGFSLTAQLSKNTYRQEEYQAPYTVEVPYQVEETYIDKVPYTVEVPYTDYETDYRNEYRCEDVTHYRDEYRCHDVTRYRDEYRCENVTRYREEQRCETVTRYRERCENKQECHLVPGRPGECREVEECGTNAHGQRICKTRRVCDSNGEPQRQCENRRVCEREPYTDRECRTERIPYTEQECRNERVPYSEQECRNERVPYTEQECKNVSVPYQKPVTKYRTETRYNEVTKTRTVTKYRTEDRCCRTETRNVFDKQLQYTVQIQLPADAILIGSETDQIKIKLDSVNPVKVSIENLTSQYHYLIGSQKASGEIITVSLVTKPQFNQTNAGTTSVTKLKIDYDKSSQKFVISYKDALKHNKLKTTAVIDVYDLETNALIESHAVVEISESTFGIKTQSSLNQRSKIKAILKVKREGLVVESGSISFSQEKTYEYKGLTADEIKSYSDANLVTVSVAKNSGTKTVFQITDKAATNEMVQTRYLISITVVKKGSAISPGSSTTHELLTNHVISSAGQVALSQILKESDLKTYAKAGNEVIAQMTTQRTIQGDQNQNISFTKRLQFNLN